MADLLFILLCVPFIMQIYPINYISGVIRDFIIQLIAFYSAFITKNEEDYARTFISVNVYQMCFSPPLL